MIEVSRTMQMCDQYDPIVIILGAITIVLIFVSILCSDVFSNVALGIMLAIIIILISGIVITIKFAPKEECIKCIVRGNIDWDEFTGKYEIVSYDEEDGIFKVRERDANN